MIEGWDIGNPLYGIAGLLGLVFWLIDYFQVGKKAEIHIPPHLDKNLVRVNYKKIPLFFIGLLAWLLVTMALMGPRKPVGRTSAQKEINDIYFVVDVSRSMLAEDFPPNRLEAAKNKIREFIDLSPVDRIGIIMFSDNVFTLMPITPDLNLVKQSVDQIKIGFLGAGTNIGDALGLAIARSTSSIAANKSIVLLTDGASNTGLMSPQQAAKEAKEHNIRVHTIGIGGDPNAKLPTGRDMFGRKKYSRIPGGSMDFNALEEISEISGGKSFIAGNDQALAEVLESINKLERKKVEVSGRVVYDEYYWYFLASGFLLLLLVESLRKLILREAQ